jgi:hypothetical protein
MSQEEFCPDPFAVEHVVPRSLKGTNDPQNLAFSCLDGNNLKYTFTKATDPSSGRMVPLFHPRKHHWTEHFAWDETFTLVAGLTPVGRATIVRLQLNRPGLQRLRAVLILAGRHPPTHSLP